MGKERRKHAIARWAKALRSLAGQLVDAAAIDHLMPVALTNETPHFVRKDVITLAIKKGWLKPVGNKKWHVLPPADQLRSNAGTPAEPKLGNDRGTLTHVPQDQLATVLNEVLRVWEAKNEVVNMTTLQDRGTLGQYTCQALSQAVSAVSLGGRKLFEKKGGTKGYTLTNAGVNARAAFQKGLQFEASKKGGEVVLVIPIAGAAGAAKAKKQPTFQKGASKVSDHQFDPTKLRNQTQVAGVGTKGFHQSPSLQKEAVMLLVELQAAEGVTTRGLLYEAFRWKYQWDEEHINKSTLGKVLNGLVENKILFIDYHDKTSWRNSPKDIITLGEKGRALLPIPPTGEADTLREKLRAANARADAAELQQRKLLEGIVALLDDKGRDFLRQLLAN